MHLVGALGCCQQGLSSLNPPSTHNTRSEILQPLPPAPAPAGCSSLGASSPGAPLRSAWSSAPDCDPEAGEKPGLDAAGGAHHACLQSQLMSRAFSTLSSHAQNPLADGAMQPGGVDRGGRTGSAHGTDGSSPCWWGRALLGQGRLWAVSGLTCPEPLSEALR